MNCVDNKLFNITEDGILSIVSKENLPSILIIPSIYNNIPVKTIKKGFCRDCNRIQKIVIEKGIEKIENDAFKWCPNLGEVSFPSTLFYIGNGAFQATAINSINIPDSVTHLGEYAFENCFNLTSVKLSENINVINKATFFNDAKLTSINISDNIKAIESNAFGCTNIEILKLPKDLQKISNSAFSYCINLKRVEMSSNIDIIEERAFEGCLKLSDIDNLSSKVEIKKNAFKNCPYNDKLAERFISEEELIADKEKDFSDMFINIILDDVEGNYMAEAIALTKSVSPQIKKDLLKNIHMRSENTKDLDLKFKYINIISVIDNENRVEKENNDINYEL